MNLSEDYSAIAIQTISDEYHFERDEIDDIFLNLDVVIITKKNGFVFKFFTHTIQCITYHPKFN
jgi:hypothetical protein